MSYTANSKQLPDHAILDAYNKQTYLGNSYVLPVSSSLTDTSEKVVAFIKNPVGNLVGVFVNLIKVSSDKSVQIKIYSNPTVNVLGAATVPLNYRTASTFAASALCYKSTSFSANGTLLGSVAAGAYGTAQAGGLYVLDAGQTLLITATAAAGTTTPITELAWYEL